VLAWHILLTQNPLPGTPPDILVWAKCDMLYTVSFDRLDKPHRKTAGKREYLTLKLCAVDLAAVFDGVRAYLPSPSRQTAVAPNALLPVPLRILKDGS
jgi:uncharacterized protein YifN (PemK superfamily)